MEMTERMTPHDPDVPLFYRDMASVTLLFSLLMMSSLRVGQSVDNLFTLKCQPAVGVIGQTTNIFCNIAANTVPIVNTVVIIKIGENDPCFTFNRRDKSVIGDDRFQLENAPSLQLQDTMISDEGEYSYFIRTSLGNDRIRFTINVTAKYHEPVISSEQKELVTDGPVDLYCNANGGYPAGTIHWFDGSKTNWTKNAQLQGTQGDDGLFTLSSKLSFKNFDPVWGEFQCIVLNNKYQEEGSSKLKLRIIGPPEDPDVSGNNSLMKNIVAATVVIGSLIVGLLIALLLNRRRFRRDNPTESVYPEEENALNEPVYKKAAEADYNIEV
ncbi:hypothetical protein QTP70_032706 [Hemibagrus guttatus]|uniref:Ig-like domain-containing protein n=1 Tax=Hemibagrus guttatus TaxID=175788 RepID=A0AAE0RLK1_9TELE|nr:hypothetical protein QTP70_032706 [Hemibagrus guttatus]